MIEFSDQLRQNQLMTSFVFPWILMVVAGVWFGFLGRRYGRSPFLWAIGGGLLGLLLTTIAEGLGHALAVPYSDAQRLADRMIAVGFATCVIAISGGLLTWRIPKPSDNPGE